MTKQRGFTLIELIIVIIILGILAVTAAPRFFNFADDARVSATQGLQAGVQGAAQTVFARAAVSGSFSANVQDITIANGYPTADALGIIEAAQLRSSDWAWELDCTADGLPSGICIQLASVANINGAGAIEDSGCYVHYQESSDPNEAPVITTNLDCT